MMPEPVTKFQSWLERLNDLTRPLSEFERRLIRAEYEAVIKNSNVSSLMRAQAFHVKGLLASDSGDFETARAAWKTATQYAPDVAVYRHNLGSALMMLNRPVEALEAMTPSLGMADNDDVGTLGNIASILFELGQYEDASAAIEEAIRVADPRNIQHSLMIAKDAATIGLNDTALVFLAKALELKFDLSSAGQDPLSVVLSAPDEWRTWRKMSTLCLLVDQYRLFGSSLSQLPRVDSKLLPREEQEQADEQARLVYEQTAKWRGDAMAAVGSVGEHDA